MEWDRLSPFLVVQWHCANQPTNFDPSPPIYLNFWPREDKQHSQADTPQENQYILENPPAATSFPVRWIFPCKWLRQN